MKTLQVKKAFFEDSDYAKKIIEQAENDAEGLIFDEFVHEIGAFLEIDVIYESLNEDETRWLIGEDRHVKLLLDEEEVTFNFEFHAKTETGEALIDKVFTKFISTVLPK
ncbi:hypothetical protein LCL95_08930 [Bacillus timonensis]|nr:hypothetical protein [Bacillus timonensis]